ncbi:MAG: hypothetical protein KC609_03850 [Myxococcales bacterium]|nr:hypothetical protein [Myxococcales bacterium]
MTTPPPAPRRESISTLLFWALLLAISAWAFREMLFALPQGIQAWPQADRFSVTLNFYDRGMNLFVPMIHNIQGNPQGITPSELPLIGYLAAAFGFLTGRETISALNRLFTLIVSAIGMVALFRFVLRRTSDAAWATLAGLFVFVAPVFLFFAGTYLHDAAACGLLLVALSEFFEHHRERPSAALAKGSAWALIATLIKASSGVYLFTIWIVGGLSLVQRRRSATRREWIDAALVIGASLALLVAYGLELRWLSSRGTSAFNYALIPRIASFADLELVLRFLYSNWVPEYLTVLQVGIWFAALVPASIVWLDDPTSRDRPRLVFLLISALGSVAFFFLFAKRFINHEYYAIAPLYPWLALAFVTALETLYPRLESRRTRPIVVALIAAMVLLSLYHHGQRVHDERLDHPFTVKKLAWMRNGDLLLAKLGVPRDACITVVGESAPNLALVHFDRRGVVLPLEHALRSKAAVQRVVAQYHCPTLIVRHRVARLYARVHPKEIARWTALGGTSRVLVFRLGSSGR